VFFSRDLKHMELEYDMRKTLQVKRTMISMLSVLAAVPPYGRFAFMVLAQAIPSIRVGFQAFQAVFGEAQKAVERRCGTEIDLTKTNPDLLDLIFRRGVSDGDPRQLDTIEVVREAWGALYDASAV
jgi:hypothetical protein